MFEQTLMNEVRCPGFDGATSVGQCRKSCPFHWLLEPHTFRPPWDSAGRAVHSTGSWSLTHSDLHGAISEELCIPLAPGTSYIPTSTGQWRKSCLFHWLLEPHTFRPLWDSAGRAVHSTGSWSLTHSDLHGTVPEGLSVPLAPGASHIPTCVGQCRKSCPFHQLHLCPEQNDLTSSLSTSL